MSKYTTQVRLICESLLDLNENVVSNGVDDVLEQTWDKVFTFKFPIFDEAYRKELCIKILRHFWTREIAHETYGAWKLRMETKLCDIMPYYNQLYKSQLLEFNPLYDVDFTRTTNRDSADTVNGVNDGTSKSTDLFSDTPQNGLQDVESGEYLTNASVSDNNYRNNNTTNSNSNENFWEKVQGRTHKPAAQLLMDFRKSFLNIDMLIIDELESLFMQLW